MAAQIQTIAIHSKRKHNKVRSGCISCKKRKVKCDETRPSCLRCVSYGQACKGYKVPKTWLFETPAIIQKSKVTSQSLVQIRPAPHPDREPLERRALLYFNEKTIPLLAAFNSVSLELWKEVIPQLGQSVEPLQHLMIAAASCQEKLSPASHNKEDNNRLAAQHYSKAVQMLIDRSRQPTPEIMLMCCLLFIACENLRVSQLQAVPHLRAGLKILRQYEQARSSDSHDQLNTSPSALWIRDLIEPTFARLEAAAGFGGHLLQGNSFDQPYDLNWKEPRVPETFPDLLAVRESFHDICQYLYFQSKQHHDFYSKNSPALAKVRRLYYLWHERAWSSAQTLASKTYKAASPSTVHLDDDHHRGMLAFEAHYQCVILCLTTCVSTTETVYDAHLSKFKDILRICQALFSYYHNNEPDRVEAPDNIFQYSPGMSPPVFIVASLCRDRVVRREATNLLRRMHEARHGVDDECVTARMAETLIALEEKGLSSAPEMSRDIPESNRVRLLAFDLNGHGDLHLMYSRAPYLGPEATIESIQVHVNAENLPFLRPAALWPISETVRLAGYQGLMRTPVRRCLCKSYGRL